MSELIKRSRIKTYLSEIKSKSGITIGGNQIIL